MLDFTTLPIPPNFGRSLVFDCVEGIYLSSTNDCFTELLLAKRPIPFHPFLLIIVYLKYSFSAVSLSSYSASFFFCGVEIT